MRKFWGTFCSYTENFRGTFLTIIAISCKNIYKQPASDAVGLMSVLLSFSFDAALNSKR